MSVKITTVPSHCKQVKLNNLWLLPISTLNYINYGHSAQNLRYPFILNLSATFKDTNLVGEVFAVFKGEVRSWFNLISEERVKFSEQNSENLMKIGWKIRKLWNFEVSQIFRKHFLTSPYEYANEWVDDVIASLLAIYFVHKILKILFFCPNLG